MANIALLVPNDELFRLAHDALQEMKKRLFMMKVIETESAVTEARQAINQGADVIIARGLQATIIKQYTDIPVVEIVMTRQGLIDMLEKAKRVLNKPDPHIAIVMFKNMTCDMTGLDERCQVHLKEYFVQNPELLQAAAMQAIEDKADLIIGGRTVLNIADNAGVPALFLANTEDAVKNAVKEAFLLADTFDSGSIPAHAIIEKDKRSVGKDTKFVNFPYKSSRMQAVVDLAEKLSKTDCPKLIIEPLGTLHRAFVNAMHNKSKHSQEKLVIYDCIKGQSAYDDLYGRSGKVNDALKGTLVINNVEYLDERSQQKILEILMFRNIILVAKTKYVEKYLTPELYARLSAFAMYIPELMDTPEDIPFLANIYIKTCNEKYGKYHVLTKDGEKEIAQHLWAGGRIQLESYIERMVITAEHRNLKASDVDELYSELYGDEQETNLGKGYGTQSGMNDFARDAWKSDGRIYGGIGMDDSTDAVSGHNRTYQKDRISGERGLRYESSFDITPALKVQELERDKIMATLSSNMGNREKTAAELGISKTTLWRKLKKYKLITQGE